MKTNELSHVQRCFTLPAPISIRPSGRQAWIRHLEGRECGGVEERGSPFPSRLADAPSGPLKPNDIRLTKKSRLTSRLILSCFKTPLLQLLRHDASLDAFIWFFFKLLLPLFSPRWPSYIKAGLGILLRKWAASCVLSNLSWYAGETIKEETDRAISPVSYCSRAGKALGL